MAGGIIYQVSSDGSLTRMMPGKPANEDEIQRMIADHPEMVTGSDDRLLLIERESAIADRLDGSGRWSLDHLFVTRDGRPVLVEVKQASNTQLRREVVGQLMEYAANASVHWTSANISASFLRTYGGDEEAAADQLDAFLNEGGDPSDTAEPEAFWRRVESNLRAGDMLLAIVADEIPRELARIVEYLNEQMRATVQAVELRWYVSAEGGKMLVPRIIGATERASVKKPLSNDGEQNEYWISLKQIYPDLLRGKPWRNRSQDFFTLRSNPKVVIGCRFVGNELKLFAYFDYAHAKTAYHVVERHKNEVEQAFGKKLEWDPMEKYQAARIVYSLPDAPMEVRGDWNRQHKWLHDHGIALGEALKPLLPEIEQAVANITAS